MLFLFVKLRTPSVFDTLSPLSSSRYPLSPLSSFQDNVKVKESMTTLLTGQRERKNELIYFRTSYHSPILSEAERLCSVCDFAPRPMRFCSANFAVRRWRHHVEELCRRQRCLGMQPCEGACLRCGSARSPWHLCKNGRGGVIHNLQYIKMSHDCFCLYV